MKICIPVLENKFLESEVSDHFGKAPLYVVASSEDGEIAGLIDRGGRGPEACAPVEAMLAKGVEAVACRGLGQGAFARLRAGGIRVFRTPHRTVEAVLWALQAGGLEEMQPGHTCAGEHGGHSHHGHGGC
jgi:predicted Fe-Mo cluster-binding NifX family protein